MPTKQTNYLTPMEVATALNNATAAVFNSKAILGLSPARKTRLMGYLDTIVDEFIKHTRTGDITGEELVAVFAAATLLLHVFLVSKGGVSKHLAMYQTISKDLLADGDN